MDDKKPNPWRAISLALFFMIFFAYLGNEGLKFYSLGRLSIEIEPFFTSTKAVHKSLDLAYRYHLGKLNEKDVRKVTAVCAGKTSYESLKVSQFPTCMAIEKQLKETHQVDVSLLVEMRDDLDTAKYLLQYEIMSEHYASQKISHFKNTMKVLLED